MELLRRCDRPKERVGGGGGRDGSGWTGHPELFTGLPFSMQKTIKGLWGCSKFFAELIKLWFNESLHQTKYFIVYAVTAAQITAHYVYRCVLCYLVLNIAINILTSEGDYFRKLLRDRLAHKSSSTFFSSTKRDLEIIYVLDPSAHWPHASRNEFDLWLKHWYSGTSI